MLAFELLKAMDLYSRQQIRNCLVSAYLLLSLISLKVDPLREFQGAQGRARRKTRRTRGP